MKDDKGESPFALSLKSDNVEAAHYLLSHGGANNRDHAKLLCLACKCGELNIVKELVEKYEVDPKCKYYCAYFLIIIITSHLQFINCIALHKLFFNPYSSQR